MSIQTKKPIIFLAFANVRDDSVPYLRNLPEEQRQIREVLEKVRVAGLYEIVEQPNTTTREILYVLRVISVPERVYLLLGLNGKGEIWFGDVIVEKISA